MMKILYSIFLSFVFWTFPQYAYALSNAAKVPVLLYHSSFLSAPCGYANNAGLALEQDLETIRSAGFTVVPVYWIAEWATGTRDGSTLPAKVVGITFDDGFDLDWFDNPPAMNGHPCNGKQKSFRSVLQAFKQKYSASLPWYSPHAASFVIASPVARQKIFANNMSDYWWSAANSSGFMEIYNHSADHDHSSVKGPIHDVNIGGSLPIGGYGDGNWVGQLDFSRINTYTEAQYEIAKSASYIAGKIAPAWPDLFAYPFGHASCYLVNTYFPNYWAQHQTFAAFNTEIQPNPKPGTCPPDGNYVKRGQNRFNLPRITHGYSWSTPSGLLNILNSAQ